MIDRDMEIERASTVSFAPPTMTMWFSPRSVTSMLAVPVARVLGDAQAVESDTPRSAGCPR